MWKKIIDLKFLTVAKYYFLGILLAVIVFQFATKSIHKVGFDFSSLIEKELLIKIISTLIGGLGGGIVFILMTINKNDRQFIEEKLWVNINEKNSLFFIRNIIAFSIGGFVYKLSLNLFELTNFDNLIQTLFSKDSIIDYVGMILAMSAFSILLSIGIKKRLNLLYKK